MRGTTPFTCARRCLTSALFVTLALFGCDNTTGPDNDLFFRFEAGGMTVEYTNQTALLSIFSPDVGQQYLFIGAYDATTLAAIEIYDVEPITTATYTGDTVGGTVSLGVVIRYDAGGGIVYEGDGGAPANGIVTITEITRSRVRGTFSGTLSATDQDDLVITNGEFLVSRSN